MSRAGRRTIAHLGLGAIVAGLAALRVFPPERYAFYPRCPVFAWLHVLCPGCGATRALAALLHGQFREALHWNLMAVALLPFLIAFLGKCYLRTIRSEKFVWPTPSESWLKVCLLAVGIFTIARNLPI